MIELTKKGKEYYRNLLAREYFELSVMEQNRRDILFDITYEPVDESMLFRKGRDSSLGRLFGKAKPDIKDLFKSEYNEMIKEGYIERTTDRSGDTGAFEPSKARQR